MPNAVIRAICMMGLAAVICACFGCGNRAASPSVGAAPGAGPAASTTPTTPANLANLANPADRIAALDREITHLEAEATRLKDVSDIKRLQRAFGYYFDAAEWDQMADLFADDGSIEMGLDGVYVGKAHIRAYLHALGGGRVGLRPGELNVHMQLQPVIDVAPDGRTAKGRWRALIMTGQYHKTALWGEGPYENDYIKENGVWKIRKVHWYQTFVVPYAGGWAKEKDVNGGVYVSRKLPPDTPPSERYATWPGVYTPPYHYKNPVTGK